MDGVKRESAPHYLLRYGNRRTVEGIQRNFEFVISFVHQDYDARWEKIAAQSPQLLMCWRGCGLLDQEGWPRPALATWNRYFNEPVAANHN